MKKRRIIAAIAAVSIAAAAFTGCTQKETETVNTTDTIKVFTKLKNRPDCALVSQELSKITAEKIGVNVEFMFGYDADKITLMLASNEQMDIDIIDEMDGPYAWNLRYDKTTDTTVVEPVMKPGVDTLDESRQMQITYTNPVPKVNDIMKKPEDENSGE